MRDEGRSRRNRRREALLRALLEEEEHELAEPEEELSAADMALLLRELRRGRRSRPSLGQLMSSEQLQGFLWGMGAATLLIMLMPTAKEKLRPLAVSTMKGALDLADQVKALFGGAGEDLQDLLAEVQFERLKEAADPANKGGPST